MCNNIIKFNKKDIILEKAQLHVERKTLQNSKLLYGEGVSSFGTIVPAWYLKNSENPEVNGGFLKMKRDVE